MIEGQPQPRPATGRIEAEFSGLVIEGQPQLNTLPGSCDTEFSGLVIEGQPQHYTDLKLRLPEINGPVIESKHAGPTALKPYRNCRVALQNLYRALQQSSDRYRISAMTIPLPRHPLGAMTMKDFCQWAGIGRTTAYEQVSAGKLTVRKVGRRSLVLFEDALRWLDALPTQNDQLEERLSDHFMNGGIHEKPL